MLLLCCQFVAGLLPLKCLTDNDVADVATFGSYMYALLHSRSKSNPQPIAHSPQPTACKQPTPFFNDKSSMSCKELQLLHHA
jgi:hypothetical protein